MECCDTKKEYFSAANPSIASKRDAVIGVNAERSEPKGSIDTYNKERYKGRGIGKEKGFFLIQSHSSLYFIRLKVLLFICSKKQMNGKNDWSRYVYHNSNIVEKGKK
jgi:hypothetical protein